MAHTRAPGEQPPGFASWVLVRASRGGMLRASGNRKGSGLPGTDPAFFDEGVLAREAAADQAALRFGIAPASPSAVCTRQPYQPMPA
jgi:hypothetical protein